MDFLVTYGTTDGQTQKIAERIGSTLRSRGHGTVVADIRDLPERFDLSKFDAILVGGSMHVQGYQRRVRRFIEANAAALNAKPSAFFSVCLSIASKDPHSRDEAEAIPRRFLKGTAWSAGRVAVFAGAARFTRYGFLRRPIMRRICEKELGIPIDVHRDYVMTDWSAVEAFARGFADSAVLRGEPRHTESHASI